MIDAKKISEKMGVKVVTGSFDEKILAIGSIKNNQQALIIVNDHFDDQIQNFVTAHQLGHFVQDHFRKLNVTELKDKRSTINSMTHIDEIERNATKFALRLLAPPFVLNGLIRKGITEPEQLSKILGIEKELMKTYFVARML